MDADQPHGPLGLRLEPCTADAAAKHRGRAELVSFASRVHPRSTGPEDAAIVMLFSGGTAR